MLLVVESWHNAGTEQYVYLLVKELKEHHVDVELIVLGSVDESHLEKCKSVFSKITLIKNNNSSFLGTVRNVYSSLNKSKAKVVHYHLYSNLYVSTLIARFLNKKIISTYHIPFTTWSFRHKLAWFVSSYLSHQNIVVAEMIEHEFKKYNLKKTVVINPPVNMSTRKTETETSSSKLVGVGRLSNMQKDWPTLIKAIHLLKKDRLQNIKLTICGGGPDEAILHELINELELHEEVALTGHLDKHLIEHILSQSDIFVLPSKFEGFGIAPVEAMQIGLPTITANYPASQDYITHDITGWSFPIGDAQALANLIQQVIDQPIHTQKVAKAGQALAIDKFSPHRIAQQHINLYRKITGK